MLVSSSVYSLRTPEPGGHCYSGGTSSVAATEQKAAIAGPENGSQPMDIVILWGPGQCREDLEAITDAASNAALKFRVIETASDYAQQNNVVEDLYLSDALGPHTQLVACFASSNGEALKISERGEVMRAMDLIYWVRTPPRTHYGPLRPSWEGTIHAVWQQSGKVRDYYDPERPLWKTGPTITHSCRKGGTDHNSITAIKDLCAYIGEAKSKTAYLEPAYIAARMLGVTGDTLACVGGRFKRAVMVGAPRTSAQAQYDHLIASLEGRNGEQERIAGARKDLRAVARAMRQPVVRGEESQRQMTKTENVFVTRAERAHLQAMAELLTRYPSLLRMRECSGLSGAQIYNRVANTVTMNTEVNILRARQGNATNLNRLLESIASLCRDEVPVRLDLARVLHGRADLLAAGLRWASINDVDGLFMHLLPAVGPADKPALQAQCLVLALQNSPSLAIGILGMYYPNATLAQLIDRGMQQGASKTVVLAWLSQLDWMAGHDSAALVLGGLCETGLFPRLPALLAEQSPPVFKALVEAMRQDKDRYSSYAEGLLDYAQVNQDASLYRQLEQGYFLTNRGVDARSADTEANAVHGVGTDV